MEPAVEELVSELAVQGYTVRAIRKVCDERGEKLPKADHPIVQTILESLLKENKSDEYLLEPS